MDRSEPPNLKYTVHVYDSRLVSTGKGSNSMGPKPKKTKLDPILKKPSHVTLVQGEDLRTTITTKKEDNPEKKD